MKYYLDSPFFFFFKLIPLFPPPIPLSSHKKTGQLPWKNYGVSELEGAVAQIPLEREIMLPSTVNPASHGVLTSFLENGIPALDSCGQ